MNDATELSKPIQSACNTVDVNLPDPDERLGESLPEWYDTAPLSIPFLYKDAKENNNLRDADDQLTINLKKSWTKIIAFILVAEVLFQYVYTYQIGTGKLNFEKYEWLVQIVMGGNFASIVMLAQIILRYLFSSTSRPGRNRKS